MIPESITSWLYPEMLQTLLDGGYYNATCPNCTINLIIKGELMINSPKGILMIPTGPPDKVKNILFNLELVDETGKPYSSQEISDRLRSNLEKKNFHVEN